MVDDAQGTIATLKSQLAASQAEAASCAKSLEQAEVNWHQQEQDLMHQLQSLRSVAAGNSGYIGHVRMW